MSARKFIIVSGQSGAGKSTALHALEDAGYYCVDNLPAGFLVDFARFIVQGDLPHYRRVAVGVDARNPPSDLQRFPSVLDSLGAMDMAVELIFIEASDETLINRFSETRRKHPLSSDSVALPRAISAEHKILEPLVARADLRIDTTRTNIHEFRARIHKQIARRESGALALQILSFGYKNGVPTDADFVFDVRCLPNPYWDPTLRDLSGRDDAVCAFLDGDPSVDALVQDLVSFLDRWIGRFECENRSYLTVAFGCTGGRHRSVYIAERVAAYFEGTRRGVLLNHRES